MLLPTPIPPAEPSTAAELWSLYDHVPTVHEVAKTIIDVETGAVEAAVDVPITDGFWRGDFYFQPTDVGIIVTARSGLDDTVGLSGLDDTVGLTDVSDRQR